MPLCEKAEAILDRACHSEAPQDSGKAMVEVGNLYSQALCALIGPVNTRLAVPLILVLESYAKELREQFPLANLGVEALDSVSGKTIITVDAGRRAPE